jgi:flagellar biosynthesis protein FlhF
MHIKRFTAPTLKAAMNAVKKEFGTDALILNTKRLHEDAGRSFEVVAAIDFDIDKLAPSPGPIVELKELIAEPAAAPPVTAGVDADEIRRLVSNELGEIKEMLMTITAAAETPVSGAVRALAREMIANGIEKGLAKRMLAKTCTGVKVKRGPDYMKLRLREFFSEAIKVSDPLVSGRIAAFIGPPGVGKTTTIAKLAAIHALKKKRRIALLTMDNFRIAATEQLRIYGKIVGIPVDAAKTPEELGSLIREHSDKDLILIDTAGRGPEDKEHFKRLRQLADIEPAIKFNLVLNSQIRDDALAGAVRAYDEVPVDSLTFTKLDEGSVYGPIFNTMMQTGKPVAYTTSGQRVPEDIEIATREGLLNYILPN